MWADLLLLALCLVVVAAVLAVVLLAETLITRHGGHRDDSGDTARPPRH